jgi:hypothetical protein
MQTTISFHKNKTLTLTVQPTFFLVGLSHTTAKGIVRPT